VTFNFDEMIHAERSDCLRSLPPFSGTVLSVGCAGASYFDWFTECTQHRGRHIGLELYRPKPEGLAPNVDWIANSVERMEAVSDASVDLVFSGQNLEHVSANSLSGFVLEASRILKDQGLLAVDSPNRAVTQHLGYVQPEHTLELTVDEMTQLLTLAGFGIVDVRGIWLVVDPITHQRMQIGSSEANEMSTAQRQQGARFDPSHSFIWWVNARKKRPPDAAAVRRFVDEVFFKQYPGFVSCRFDNIVGRKQWDWGASMVQLDPGDVGYALYGPYVPLIAGGYSASFSMRPDGRPLAPEVEVTLDVVSAVGTVTHGRRVVSYADLAGRSDWANFQVPFDLSGYTPQLEARCHVRGFAGSVLGHVDLLPLR
jgi:hypothetical protein